MALIGLSVPAAAADVNAPAQATAAVITLAAVAGKKHIISQITYSYSATPTGGNLKVEDVSGTTVFNVDVPAAGVGQIFFRQPLRGAAANTAMIITLASGAGTVVGKVNVIHWTEE